MFASPTYLFPQEEPLDLLGEFPHTHCVVCNENLVICQKQSMTYIYIWAKTK